MEMKTEQRTRDQRGIVLLLALVALLLISAVGAAILYMTATESSLVGFQRTTTRAYEGARGGLSEGRSRLSTSDPSFIGTATFTIDFPAAPGEVLYIANRRPSPGEFTLADVTANAASPYYDWEYDLEWCPAGNPACGALAAATIQAVDSDMVPLAGLVAALPELPYKWVRVTALTEEAAKRDINGDGALDNTIPVTWDSISNRMNIIVTPGTLVDRDGDGTPESNIDTDGDGTVERNERLGRYVYRVTALSRVQATGATRLVQYDVSAPFLNLWLPSAVSLVGQGSSCGPNLGCDPSVMPSGCDSPADFGPSNALDSEGQDQAPGANPGDGGPAIGCTDPATCTDCSNELDNIMRANNWTGNCAPGDPACPCADADPNTACTSDITASSSTLVTAQGLQLLIDSVRAVADQVFLPDGASPDTPPQTDGDPGNDTITYTGGMLGRCDNTVNQPQVTVFDGDVSLSSSSQGGCGILLVTGTLNVSGDWNWKGPILVLGEGVFNSSGTGSMQGAQVVARIYCQDGDPGPCPCAGGTPVAQCFADGTLIAPQESEFNFNGGGNGGWDYNSLWLNNAFGGSAYQVLAYREMTR